jgi:hypothetical protein
MRVEADPDVGVSAKTAMEEKMSTGRSKADFVADVLNKTLSTLVINCTKRDAVCLDGALKSEVEATVVLAAFVRHFPPKLRPDERICYEYRD